MADSTQVPIPSGQEPAPKITEEIFSGSLRQLVTLALSSGISSGDVIKVLTCEALDLHAYTRDRLKAEREKQKQNGLTLPPGFRR